MGSRFYPPESSEGTETDGGQAANQVLPHEPGLREGPASASTALGGCWLLRAYGDQWGFRTSRHPFWRGVGNAATDVEGPSLGKLFHGWCSCPNIHKRLRGIKDGKIVVVTKATGGGSVIATYP